LNCCWQNSERSCCTVYVCDVKLFLLNCNLQ